MLLRNRLLSAASLILVGLISVSAINALAVNKPAVETLLETQTTNIGQAIAYPSGAARITAVVVTLASGARRPAVAAIPYRSTARCYRAS